VEHRLHLRTAKSRGSQTANGLKLDPLELQEVERLQVVEVVHTSVEASVDDEPVAKDSAAVISSACLDAVQIFDLHFLP